MKLLLIISLMSLFCNGWYMITHHGMLLDPARKFFLTITGGWERNDGGIEWDDPEPSWFKFILVIRFIYKPLFGCIICMSSIPGSVAYWTISHFTNENLIYWPIACVCASFTNYFLFTLIKRLED